MATNNIPVSFDFFKKYTYHEEIADFMFKLKANGDQKKYEALLNNKESAEQAIRKYYEAFYLQPKIREKHHIRVKPVPKKIKDLLLQIPVTCTSNESSKGSPNKVNSEGGTVVNSAILSDMGTVKNSTKSGEDKKGIMLAKPHNSEEIFVVEDDSEPLGSPDDTATEKQNEKENSTIDTDTNIVTNAKENPNQKNIDKDITEKNTKLCTDVSQDNENAGALSSRSNIPIHDYKALKAYMNCCPLTLNEFRKYSNITELLTEHCGKLKLDAFKQGIVLERSYMLFYLLPEYRTKTPINKIKLLDNCPEYIKEKFFSIIPTTLYAKETKSTNTIGKSEATAETNINPNCNSELPKIIDATTTSTIADCHKTQPVIILPPTTSSVINSHGATKKQSTNCPVAETSTNRINVNVIHKENSEVEKQEDCVGSTHPITATTKIDMEKQSLESSGIFPISLIEFKKYIYYEEIVEKLYKIKAQDNKDLFLKYKSSQEAFDSTLENFYRAFYLLPVVRKIFPIRLKPMPNCIKTRILSIPTGIEGTDCKNFKVEQLVSVEFTAENKSKESQAAAQQYVCTNSKIENKESSNADNESNSSLVGIKRASNENIESSSSKRKKILQSQNNFNKNENVKKSYKDLLPYAHCCPITFTEFTKYTNISELLTGSCKKRYNSLKKLPYILHRAYVLYYLAPENRQFKPYNNLKILDECPSHLRDKIFVTPLNIYLKEYKKNVVQKLETKTQTKIKIEKLEESLKDQDVTTTDKQIHKAIDNRPKDRIQILENRLLPTTAILFSASLNKDSIYCSNTGCVFCHISYLDFMNSSNILSILPEPHGTTAIKNAFKLFVYKLINEQCCDKQYLIKPELLCKLFKYQKICENCENDVHAVINLNRTTTSSVSESDSTSNVTSTTVVERISVNTESSIENQGGSLAKNTQTPQTSVTNKEPADSGTHLKRYKIFSKFCHKLLVKLNQFHDDTVDFSSDCYKIFLECNEIPLAKILNDFCGNNENIVQRILNQSELCETLKRYYYLKYLTKYPVQARQSSSDEECSKRQENSTEGQEDEEQNPLTKSSVTSELNQTIANCEKTTTNNVTNISSGLEKAKRIFFRYVDKFHTLAYVLRTSFGYKQKILRTILSLTFEEFHELTRIYEGNELYNDNHIAECMYRYVFRTPLVWPTNLYIKLEHLYKFLHKNYILFKNCSTMLTYISPKLLHWTDLLRCTNILDCVKIDYEKRTAKLLDNSDLKSLKQACVEYYNRCWKHEKWLGETPIIYKEFYNQYLKDTNQGDVMLDGSSPQEGVEVSAENDDNIAAVNGGLVCIQKTTEIKMSDEVNAELNCVYLPNTQQQIKMLPAETTVSSDPLDECCDNALDLINISLSSNESPEVDCIVEDLAQTIKTEPIEGKLLSNMLFYEDDNSNMQCLTCEEEIHYLENTMESQEFEENLPQPQMDFEDSVEQRLYNVLMNSDDSRLSINLAQQIPSSAISNHATICTQGQFMPPSSCTEFTATQLPDRSFEGIIENRNRDESVAEKNLQTNIAAEPTEEKNICLENDASEQYLDNFLEHQNQKATEISVENLSLEQTILFLKQEIAKKNTSEGVEEIIKNNLFSIGTQQQEQVNMDSIPIYPSTSKTLANIEDGKNSCKPSIAPARLPRHKINTKTNTATRSSRNIATVKPLTQYGLVPQIQHNTRPLQTIPAHGTTSSSSSNDNQVIPPVSEISAPTSVVLNLTPSTSNSDHSTGQSSQNSNFQLQLSNLGGSQIFISQELNKNCSVFDNSSLLRIADHNYHKQTTTITQTEDRVTFGNSGKIYICPDNNTLANKDSIQNDNEQTVTITTTTAAGCPRSVTQYNTNDKNYVFSAPQ